jgi:hypothetical protein
MPRQRLYASKRNVIDYNPLQFNASASAYAPDGTPIDFTMPNTNVFNTMGYNFASIPNNTANTTSGGRFSKLADWFNGVKSGKPIFGNVQFPNLSEGLRNLRNAKLFEGSNVTLGNTANTLGGLYQGINALKNINTLSTNDADLQSLQDDIKSSAYSNPMLESYLSANDSRLLRQIRNGSYDGNVASSNLGNGIGGAVKGLPKAAIAAILGGLAGGGAGAAIQGIGSLVNSGLQGAASGQSNRQAQLQSLYETLQAANQDYRDMRRPQNLGYSGLQRRYANMYA